MLPHPEDDQTLLKEEVPALPHAEEPGAELTVEQVVGGQPAATSPEAPLPPEAQGDTNGGPLGCCLGITVGILLSLIIAVFSRLYADPLASVFSGGLGLTVRIVMALAALTGAIVCGYVGWRIGKRVYREYDPPVVKDRRRQTKAGRV